MNLCDHISFGIALLTRSQPQTRKLLCRHCFLYRSPLWTSGISPKIALALPFLGPWGHLTVALEDHLPGPWWDHWPFAGCPGNPSSTYHTFFMGTSILGSQKSRQDKLRGCYTLTIAVNNASQRRKWCGLFLPPFPVSILHIIFILI